MIDERGGVNLLGLLNRRSLYGGEALSFATYFEIEIERQPEPIESRAHFDLIGPDGTAVHSETLSFSDGIDERDPSRCTFSTRFELPNFLGRGPHEVALVIDGALVIARRLEVSALP
jgi:hypothetical protein